MAERPDKTRGGQEGSEPKGPPWKNLADTLAQRVGERAFREVAILNELSPAQLIAGFCAVSVRHS